MWNTLCLTKWTPVEDGSWEVDFFLETFILIRFALDHGDLADESLRLKHNELLYN